ncbi:MAG: alpha/beta hydrolase [Ilumatobacteraceae bacterium]
MYAAIAHGRIVVERCVMSSPRSRTDEEGWNAQVWSFAERPSALKGRSSDMQSEHLLDAELRDVLSKLPVPKEGRTLAEIRSSYLPGRDWGDLGVSMETITVAGPTGAPDIRLRIYRPGESNATLPWIYYIHGGGYITGDVERYESRHRKLVSDLDCALVAVTYRLSPENVFPAAIDDCYAGLSGAIERATQLGLHVERYGVMGDSAGGGLAAGLSLMARDRKEHALQFQHLIYPMLDDRTCVSDDPHPYVGEYVFNAASNHFCWMSMLGEAPGGSAVSPYAAPSRAIDLTGLPSTYIASGALDLFLEEDIEYGRRLTRAGVPLELHIYPGACHGFDLFETELGETARLASIAALRRSLGRVAN